MIFRWLANRIIARSMRTPYRKGHIYGADGSLYMRRFALFETKWLSARVHHIAREDRDRHMHDHPWTFVSVVLRGGYLERRPETLEPCFDSTGTEMWLTDYRPAGSVALRLPTDRHMISDVAPDTWSLFVYGRVRQWWGFFTPGGKIHWADYTKESGAYTKPAA